LGLELGLQQDTPLSFRWYLSASCGEIASPLRAKIKKNRR